MSSLVFLGIAAAISIVGFAILWYFNRPPRSIEAHMEEFNHQLQALSPETGLPRSGRSRRGGRTGPTAEGGRRSG